MAVKVYNPNVAKVHGKIKATLCHDLKNALTIAKFNSDLAKVSVRARPKGCTGNPRRAVLCVIDGGVK